MILRLFKREHQLSNLLSKIGGCGSLLEWKGTICLNNAGGEEGKLVDWSWVVAALHGREAPCKFMNVGFTQPSQVEDPSAQTRTPWRGKVRACMDRKTIVEEQCKCQAGEKTKRKAATVEVIGKRQASRKEFVFWTFACFFVFFCF